jgi:hypothetical protein
VLEFDGTALEYLQVVPRRNVPIARNRRTCSAADYEIACVGKPNQNDVEIILIGFCEVKRVRKRQRDTLFHTGGSQVRCAEIQFGNADGGAVGRQQRLRQSRRCAAREQRCNSNPTTQNAQANSSERPRGKRGPMEALLPAHKSLATEKRGYIVRVGSTDATVLRPGT